MEEAGKNRRRDLRIKPVGRVDLRDVFVRRGEATDLQVGFDAEDGLDIDQNRWFRAQT